MRYEGMVVWFTGLSGSGKTTLAERLTARLLECECQVELIDGDAIRQNLSQGLGFSRQDRDINIARIGYVAELLSRHGIIAVVAAISPYLEAREQVRQRVRNFVEVYTWCPLDILIARDPKGLYRQALKGDIKCFTGISDPYEPPVCPDVMLRTDHETVEEDVDRIWGTLVERELIFPLADQEDRRWKYAGAGI